jgi:simple sugar transport system permease protein
VLAIIAGTAVLVTLIVTWIATGIDPWEAVGALFEGATGDVDAVAETLVRAAPLALVGVGAALGLRGGVVNVGGEGQMIIGAVFAAVVTGWLVGADGSGVPTVLAWVIALVVGGLGGAAWAVVPAALAATRGVPEILSTLLVNFATVGLVTWLLTKTFLQDPDPLVITAQGESIPERLEFPALIDGTRMHFGVGFALVMVLLTAWWLRTPGGFRLDLLGANPSLAAQAGVPVVRARAMWLLISAGFAGIAGVVQLFGISHRLTPGLTGGVGYTGVLVAVLGRSRPLATGAAAIGFAALATGSEQLERDGAPREVVLVLQAVLVIATAVAIRPRPAAA